MGAPFKLFLCALFSLPIWYRTKRAASYSWSRL